MSESHEVKYTNCSGINVANGMLQFTGVREDDESAQNWTINLDHVESYSALQTGGDLGIVYTVVYTNLEEGEGQPLN